MWLHPDNFNNDMAFPLCCTNTVLIANDKQLGMSEISSLFPMWSTLGQDFNDNLTLPPINMQPGP
jgi:hypothetical protein